MKLSLVSAFLFLIWSSGAQANCPTNTRPGSGQIDGKPICFLSGVDSRGNYPNSDLKLTPDFAWVLDSGVIVGGDNRDFSTLTIEPGTTVYGNRGSFLNINRGSKLIANGTFNKPVVFTSSERDKARQVRGMWGGIVINGRAPINNCAGSTPVCEAKSEGISQDPPSYGGSDKMDNSGILKFVRVEFAGFEVSPNNELNGVTFNGVGAGTTVEYLQVHMGADDGVEFFGGTVNAKYLILTDNDDDPLDWDNGYAGKIQFVIAESRTGEETVNGIEADNHPKTHSAQPRSNPIISNVTIIARGSNEKLQNGILFRAGTAGWITNAVITGDWKVACFNIDNDETFRNGGAGSGTSVQQGQLRITRSLVYCPAGNNFREEPNDPYSVSAFFKSGAGNLIVDPQLTGWRPSEDSPVVGSGATPQVNVDESGFAFTTVDFMGALSPFEDEDWTIGWSITSW